MIKFDVLNRFTGAVQFTAEIDCKDGSSTAVKLGLAVKWAIKNSTNLSDADLSGADLRGASLYGADLRGADLRGANLSGADLSGADLSGADLYGADLRCADLSDADLSGADLRGASLYGADLRGADLLVLQGFGSRACTLYAYKTKNGVIQIRTGCFFGTLKEFLVKSKEAHGETLHGKDYALIGKLIKQHFKEGGK